MPLRRSLDQDFFKTWSPNMAYVLGFFAADGCMIKNTRGGLFIEFTSTDRMLLEHIQGAAGSSQCIAERPSRNEKWKAQYRLQIGSKEWFADLTTLGFTAHKSRTLSFPDVPPAVIADFVRGYFDGDGCVYFNQLKFADRTHERWILLTLFTSGSRAFLESLHIVLKERGVVGGSMCTKARGFELKFSHRDSLALYRFMYHTVPTSRLFLPRKREKLERAVQVLGLDKNLRS